MEQLTKKQIEKCIQNCKNGIFDFDIDCLGILLNGSSFDFFITIRNEKYIAVFFCVDDTLQVYGITEEHANRIIVCLQLYKVETVYGIPKWENFHMLYANTNSTAESKQQSIIYN